MAASSTQQLYAAPQHPLLSVRHLLLNQRLYSSFHSHLAHLRTEPWLAATATPTTLRRRSLALSASAIQDTVGSAFGSARRTRFIDPDLLSKAAAAAPAGKPDDVSKRAAASNQLHASSQPALPVKSSLAKNSRGDGPNSKASSMMVPGLPGSAQPVAATRAKSVPPLVAEPAWGSSLGSIAPSRPVSTRATTFSSVPTAATTVRPGYALLSNSTPSIGSDSKVVVSGKATRRPTTLVSVPLTHASSATRVLGAAVVAAPGTLPPGPVAAAGGAVLNLAHQTLSATTTAQMQNPASSPAHVRPIIPPRRLQAARAAAAAAAAAGFAASAVDASSSVVPLPVAAPGPITSPLTALATRTSALTGVPALRDSTLQPPSHAPLASSFGAQGVGFASTYRDDISGGNGVNNSSSRSSIVNGISSNGFGHTSSSTAIAPSTAAAVAPSSPLPPSTPKRKVRAAPSAPDWTQMWGKSKPASHLGDSSSDDEGSSSKSIGSQLSSRATADAFELEEAANQRRRATAAAALQGQANVERAKAEAAAAAAAALAARTKHGRGASASVFGKSEARAAAVAAATAGAGGVRSEASEARLVQRDGQWFMDGYEADMRGLVAATPLLQARLTAGVKAEQDAEAAALRRLYSGSSLHRLERDGLVLTGLVAKASGLLYRSAVWHLKLPGDRDLPYHRFRRGDTVMLSPLGSTAHSKGNTKNSSSGKGSSAASNGTGDDVAEDAPNFEGAVLEVRKGHVAVAVDRSVSEILEASSKRSGMRWRIDQSIKDTTAKRQLAAIADLASFKDPASPSECLLRAVLVGSRNGPSIAEQPPLWVCEGSWRNEARAELAAQQGLNNSQRRAVATALTRTFTLWQGPPGTGKTHTLLALVDVLVRTSTRQPAAWDAMQTVLACADTNAAVDNLVEGLAERGLRVVRVGPPAKVREHLRHLTLEAQAEATTEGRQAVSLRERSQQQLDAFTEKLQRGAMPDNPATASSLEEMREEAEVLRKRADVVLAKAAQKVLERAQVVAATCTGAGDSSLGKRIYRMVVIDEASQATEPAVLVPLTRGAHCCVMAGDPRQLPPTIVSQKAYEFGLDVTLFERMSENGIAPLLLDTQYRMHPAISAFPSAWFYNSRLKNGVTAADKAPPKGFAWPRPGIPLAVISVEDGFEQSAAGRGSDNITNAGSNNNNNTAAAAAGKKGASGDGSYKNVREAQVALTLAAELLSAGDIESVAVLSPYRGQVRAMEAMLRVQPAPLLPNQSIDVCSVDGYQGREADVVVFTTVRCNSRGAIGFVSDPRRLNVAITRPRRGLLVVASPCTLSKGSDDWRAYLKWANTQGIVVDADAAHSNISPDMRSSRGIQRPGDKASKGGKSSVTHNKAAGWDVGSVAIDVEEAGGEDVEKLDALREALSCR